MITAVLGGGQLARMLALAGAPLGLRTRCLEWQKLHSTEAGFKKQLKAISADIIMAEDPGEALTVVEAKAKGPSDAVIVVQGRIQDVTRSFGIVKLMDTALKYCGEVHAEGCKTPWDYCCDTPEAHRVHELLVEFRGPDGMPV